MSEVISRPWFQEKVKQGRAFSVSRRYMGIDNNESIYMMFENPSDSGVIACVAAVEVIPDGKSYVDIYRDFEVTVEGELQQPVNERLSSDNTAKCKVFYGGEYSLGTKAHETMAYGGTKNNAIGSLVEIGESVIIDPGYRLLFVITNKSGSTIDMSIRVIWCEDPVEEEQAAVVQQPALNELLNMLLTFLMPLLMVNIYGALFRAMGVSGE